MQTPQGTSERNLEEQKKFYKNDSLSICRKCEHINSDCFEAMKTIEKAKDSHYSSVSKCNKFEKRQESRK